MRYTDNAVNLIKKFEGYSSKPYKCSGGVWTIGWGTTGIHGKPVTANTTAIDRLTAEIYLRADMDRVEMAVNRLVKVPITQSSFDALVSFTYNVGDGALAGSTLLRKLNDKDYIGADKEFTRWVYADNKRLRGLELRRAKEQDMFDDFAPDDNPQPLPVAPVLELPEIAADDVPAILKPLEHSRTIAAATTATVASGSVAVIGEVVQQTAPVMPVLTALAQYAPWVMVALLLCGIGWMVYARLDDRNKGAR
jgi:lysozyme